MRHHRRFVSLRFASLLAALALCVGASAQTFSAGLAQAYEREIAAELERTHEPGLSVALVEGCKVQSVQAFGVADRQGQKKVTVETLFNLGSISKTPAAWLVMRLVDEGKIALDAPVNTYLKSWKLADSATVKASEVTVRRLLNHTGGISMPSVAGFDAQPLPSLLDVLNGAGAAGGEKAEKVEITGTPGAFKYSGGGYAILQRVVEDVTGKPFAQVAREKVFAPLGMASTGYGWSQEVGAKAALAYKTGGEEAHPNYQYPALAAAGLYSSAADMARFLVAHCDAAQSDKVLKRATLESMWQPTAEAPRYGYGYELPPALGPIRIVSHSGSNRGWKADFLMLPEKGLGIVVMTNVDGGETRKFVIRKWRDEVVNWARQSGAIPAAK